MSSPNRFFVLLAAALTITSVLVVRAWDGADNNIEPQANGGRILQRERGMTTVSPALRKLGAATERHILAADSETRADSQATGPTDAAVLSEPDAPQPSQLEVLALDYGRGELTIRNGAQEEVVFRAALPSELLDINEDAEFEPILEIPTDS